MNKFGKLLLHRIVALVLCAAMILPMAAVPADAAEVAIGDNAMVTFSEDTTEATQESAAAAEEPTETASTEPTEPAAEVPACNCGNGENPISGHSDGCAEKMYYMELCKGSAAQIYAQWGNLSEDARDFILQYLSWHYRTTLNELTELLNEDLTGEDAVNVEGTTVLAAGIPQGSTMTVTEASDSARTAVEDYVAAQGDDSATELFLWDFSVQDAAGADWQPNGEPVRVELQIPGVTLHKYATVYVVHVDDDGNVSTVPAEVTENGGIVFETTGFSAFAGFTVDFEYDGTQFSIPGRSTITLSGVFDQLRMPLSVSDVKDVAFSDTDLVTVEKLEDGDWLLKSIKAFTSNETLTVTMNSGTVYEINVTDDTYVTISFNKSGNLDGGTLGVVEWYLLGSGSGGQAYTSGGGSYAPGWTEDYDIYIDGTNATNKQFEIVLQRSKNASGRTLYLDLHTIWIKGGAELTFRLGASITDENTDNIVIRQVRGYHDDTYGDEWWFGELFWVENGSLELKVPYTDDEHENVRMVFDWDSGNLNKPSGNGPKALVSLRENATSFKANRCDFQNTQTAAIVSRSRMLSEFIMTDCTFQDTVKSDGNGGAIYMMSNVTDSNGTYAITHRFELNNCQFSNCEAGGYGGAVALHGYVHSGLISGCSFTDCLSTGQGGGAIEMAGCIGSFSISGSTFSGCSSKFRGGAIEIRSTNIKNESGITRWTRSNDIAVSGCTFSNLIGGSHGAAIAVKAQLNSLSVSGCDFTGCSTVSNNGTVSIDAQELGDNFKNKDGSVTNSQDIQNHKYPDWAADIDCATCETNGYAVGTTLGDCCDWGTTYSDNNIVSLINTVSITDGCTFTECSAASNGGAVEFAGRAHINSATISDATFSKCSALNGGSAIFLSDCFVRSLTLDTLNISGCDFKKDASGNYLGVDQGGTIRTIGETTVVLTMKNCTITDNTSYGHGGGLYWNAGKKWEGVDCSATVENCRFERNTVLQYGGAIYVESAMSITNCQLLYNKAYMGGAIAQQVYNNGIRTIGSDEKTELKLDPKTWMRDNEATYGGGISIRANSSAAIPNGSGLAYPVRFQLNGAAVYQNSATLDGGGIYFKAETYSDASEQGEVDSYVKEIEIDNGYIYNNSAGQNGGGIFMSSSKNTSLTVSNGYISSNYAAENGGGIYMTGEEATCTITGGKIGDKKEDGTLIPNRAGVNGGGIAISGGSVIVMNGGTISDNIAENRGGGIWLDNGTEKLYNQMTLSGGQILRNKATEEGGGVHLGRYSYFEIKDGLIDSNNAKNGGGVSMYETWMTASYAKVVVDGGTISNNVATESGGGLYAHNYGNFEVKSGQITGNVAQTGTGGGICCRYYGTSLISGGDITNNTAGTDGGGVYSIKCHLKITGGDVLDNTANDGGGIYASGYTVALEGGTIQRNQAATGAGISANDEVVVTMKGGGVSNNGLKELPESGEGIVCTRGGGVYANASTVNLAQGSVMWNKAERGGGVYAENASTIAVNGGNVQGNEARVNGGGIYCSASTIAVSNGDISENVAGSYGGGMYVKEGSSVTVGGGNVTKNEAVSGGGIHAIGGLTEYNTTINVIGGEISYNKATGRGTSNGQGGGIHADRFVTVNVKESEDKTTVGKITHNTASKGGGVYICYGAKLNVTNGHITYNKAEGTPSGKTTAWHENHGLLGVGGGVYVTSGYTEAYKAEFVLDGTDIAIYGNEADFAADDVFANGVNTKLNVPQKQEMNLSGYKFNPEGWFEDYAKNDTNYTSGLALAAANSGITDGNVFRYRGSDSSQRVLIPDTMVDSDGNADTRNVNDENVYVCMTLGLPSAVPDTIVIDYGLPVDIDVLSNENMTVANATLAGIGAAVNAEFSADLDESQINLLDSDKLNKVYTIPNGSGSVRLSSDGSKLRYTPEGMSMESEDQFGYAVKYTNSVDENGNKEYFYYYATVTIIPATTIYYEDGFLTYSVIDDDTGETVSGYGWTEVKDKNYDPDAVQAEDRPGPDVTALDADNIYGYDGAYASMTEYSLGSAAMVNVGYKYNNDGSAVMVDHDGKQEPLRTTAIAEFTFSGTGFDVVSLTSAQTGTILVEVQGVTDASFNEIYIVDTYYGYKLVDGEWVVDKDDTSTDGNDLYQVPVMKVDGLTYGKYNVKIIASWAELFDHEQYGDKQNYDFYLDAIRIYDPANDGAGNKVIEDAYVDDGEGWPEYFELRDLLINANDFNSLDGESKATGIVFIDNTADKTTNTNDDVTYSVADYKNYGPNNELYLAKNQAVTFTLNVGEVVNGESNVAGIHIAMKSTGGTAKAVIKKTSGGASPAEPVLEQEIKTATDLYYDLTAANGYTVVIQNTGDDILSITNIKVTYKSAHEDSIENDYFRVTKSGVQDALNLLEQDSLSVTDGALTPESATLSLEDEVHYNIYFSSTTGASAENMGLLVWDSKPASPSYANADEIYEGVKKENSRYKVTTDGIPAKEMGDTKYFMLYAKNTDGTYTYSEMFEYSAKQYALSRLTNSNDAKLKNLCVALLNYGAAAQTYFDYRTGDLMNAGLTATQKGYVQSYSAELLDDVGTVAEEKIGAYAATAGAYIAKQATVTLGGALELNFYFTPSKTTDAVTLHYWNEAAYATNGTLSDITPTGTIKMENNGGKFRGTVTGIAAKNMDDTIYVCGVYEVDGVKYSTGIIPYSIASYCEKKAANGDEAIVPLAKATVVYGYYAKTYFAP